jgi:hypothetical protein
VQPSQQLQRFLPIHGNQRLITGRLARGTGKYAPTGPRDWRAASTTLVDSMFSPYGPGRSRSLDPAWNAFWRIDPRPDGRPAPDGPLIKAVEDKIELIAGGQAVAIIPSAPISSLHPDLTTVPLEGVEPSHVALATRAGDRGRLVAAFRKCARSRLTGPGL